MSIGGLVELHSVDLIAESFHFFHLANEDRVKSYMVNSPSTPREQ